MPPSDDAVDGESHPTDDAGWYVYDAPLRAYCWPFIDSTTRAPPDACTGDEHSSCDASTYRASADDTTERTEDDGGGCTSDAKLNAHRSVYASRNAPNARPPPSTSPPPTTATRVPPPTGPTSGAASRAESGAW